MELPWVPPEQQAGCSKLLALLGLSYFQQFLLSSYSTSTVTLSPLQLLPPNLLRSLASPSSQLFRHLSVSCSPMPLPYKLLLPSQISPISSSSDSPDTSYFLDNSDSQTLPTPPFQLLLSFRSFLTVTFPSQILYDSRDPRLWDSCLCVTPTPARGLDIET